MDERKYVVIDKNSNKVMAKFSSIKMAIIFIKEMEMTDSYELAEILDASNALM